MKLKKKVLAAACAVVMGATTLVACGTEGQTERNADGEIEIKFWHASGGDAGRLLEAYVDEFNEEYQGQYQIDAVYQGSYETNFSKLAANIQTGFVPTLMQANDVQTAYMKDSGLTVPVEEVLGEDADEVKDGLLPAVRNYYVIDGTLWSMPLLVSQPEAYLNLDILEEAGVNPDDLVSLDDYLEAAKVIAEETGQPGLSFATNPWFVEEFTASIGEEYCTPSNGVGSERATGINLQNDANLELWAKIQEGFADGSIANVGGSQGNVASLFSANQLGLAFISSGSLSEILETDVNSELRGLPPASEEFGSVPGGNSLWVLKEGKSEEQLEAAGAFVRFVNRPEIQARNIAASGYLPSTKESYDLNMADPSLKPQQKALVQNLADTPANTVTAGCHMGAISEIRNEVGDAVGKIARGDDAKQTFADIEPEINRIIERYERRAEATQNAS